MAQSQRTTIKTKINKTQQNPGREKNLISEFPRCHEAHRDRSVWPPEGERKSTETVPQTPIADLLDKDFKTSQRAQRTEGGCGESQENYVGTKWNKKIQNLKRNQKEMRG